MKVNEKKNKYNISTDLLKKLHVAKKDYDKVYTVDYANAYVNKNEKSISIIPIVKYAYSPEIITQKHTLRPFNNRKQFFSSHGLPQKSKISSVYQNSQSQYKTAEIIRFISKFKKLEKVA